MSPLVNSTPLSPDKKDVELANFFAQTARVVMTSTPVPLSDSDQFGANGIEALSLMAFGLKNFYMGNYREAAQILGRFNSSIIPPPYDWIMKYKPLTEDILADAETYVKIQKIAAQARNPKDATEALGELKSLRGQVRTQGKIIQDILTQEQILLKKASGASASGESGGGS